MSVEFELFQTLFSLPNDREKKQFGHARLQLLLVKVNDFKGMDISPDPLAPISKHHPGD